MCYFYICQSFDPSVEELCEFVKSEFQMNTKDSLMYIETHIPKIFQIFSSKNKKPYYNDTINFCKKIVDFVSPWFSPNISNIICSIIEKSMKTEKEYGFLLLDYLIEKNTSEIRICMPELVPFIASYINDISPNIKMNSYNALDKLLKCSRNVDLDNFIPIVLKGIKDHNTTYDAVEALASCVFVQNVEAPALSITMPILLRGLNDKKTATRRLTCVIIDNMCKLIEHPKEILPFYRNLKNALERCNDTMSDPEARKVSSRALNTLKDSCANNENAIFHKLPSDFEKIIQEESIHKNIEITSNSLQLISILTTNICNSHCFDIEEWNKIYSNNQSIMEPIFNYAKKSFVVKENIFEDTEEGKDLYKGEFSLAYGALTLLNNTHLHLKQNRFYGLLGPNNCGKTTLMRAIANEQVEGFPKKDELRTIFVEHEIQEIEVGEDDRGFPILNIDLCGVDWVVHCCNVVYSMQPPVTSDQVERVMEDIGFGYATKDIGKDRAADMGMGITTYSGGWKVKMQLCAATLMEADILMLDEPTGHLDVTNIAWIKNWLKQFMDNGGSIIATSHDSGFLNEMTTHLIDFQSRKLRMFSGTRGNVLEEFVSKFPEKKGYFELKNDVVKFKFPEPGGLEGVKSMSKTLLKMTKMLLSNILLVILLLFLILI